MTAYARRRDVRIGSDEGSIPSASTSCFRGVPCLRAWMKEGDDRSGHPLLSLSNPFGTPPLGLPTSHRALGPSLLTVGFQPPIDPLGRKGVALSASPFDGASLCSLWNKVVYPLCATLNKAVYPLCAAGGPHLPKDSFGTFQPSGHMMVQESL